MPANVRQKVVLWLRRTEIATMESTRVAAMIMSGSRGRRENVTSASPGAGSRAACGSREDRTQSRVRTGWPFPTRSMKGCGERPSHRRGTIISAMTPISRTERSGIFQPSLFSPKNMRCIMRRA